MLTVFSIPKPFKGHIGTIQRNAITSWTLLRPRPEIILFGNDEGTAALAQELGLRHVPEIACNEYGTPLLGDLFRQAGRNADSKYMCYVNADILLVSDFARALPWVWERQPRFLIVSKRINLSVTEPLAFEAGWEEAVKAHSRESGVPAGHTAIDIFVFPKGTYPHVPDFGVGRLWFDQWLIKAAKESGIPVIDLSRVAPLFHQNHDYNHVAGGSDWIWKGKEAEHNLRLYNAAPHAFTLLDATHELMPDGTIRRVRFRRSAFQARQFLWRVLVQETQPLRKRLRLHRKPKTPAAPSAEHGSADA